jgi:hypothetical protein
MIRANRISEFETPRYSMLGMSHYTEGRYKGSEHTSTDKYSFIREEAKKIQDHAERLERYH